MPSTNGCGAALYTAPMILPARFAALLAAACLSLLSPLLPGRAAAAPGAQAHDGEVIVRFKADASVLRSHALGARAEAATVRTALANRAGMLGRRVGRSLEAGAAVGTRQQVVRARGVSAAALAAQLAADPDVEFAVPNGRRHALTAPNDPLYLSGPPLNPGAGTGGPASGQWYLRAPAGTVVSSINIENAWVHTTGSAGVVVAVLDSGVRSEHPDLTGRLLPGYDFVSDTTVANDGNGRDADASDPGDWVTSADILTPTFDDCAVTNSSWHGTKTASLVGASTNDGVGMAGVAPSVRILPVRVLGKCFGRDADIIAAMLWASGIHVDGVPDNPTPAKVLNLSLGGGVTCLASYQSAIDQVLAQGAVVVVAAGNGSGPVEAPANCTGVIAVMSVRHAGTKVGLSSLGPQVTLAAPGGNCVNVGNGPCVYPILAATNTGTQGPQSSTWSDAYRPSIGTSFAAPLVAGTAGLMFSARQTLTPAQIRTQLQASATAFPTTGGDTPLIGQCRVPSADSPQDECYCNTAYCGAGMLNAGLAVASVSGAVATIAVTSSTPTAGSPVTLSAAGSQPGTGATSIGYDWLITDGGGIVIAFSSATNAATATLTPSAAGSFTVRLTVRDGVNSPALATQTVVVAAAPVTPPVTPPAPSAGGGGGATSPAWLLALLAAAVVLLRTAARRA